jgi:hypothetical protein
MEGASQGAKGMGTMRITVGIITIYEHGYGFCTVSAETPKNDYTGMTGKDAELWRNFAENHEHCELVYRGQGVKRYRLRGSIFEHIRGGIARWQRLAEFRRRVG